MAVAVDHGHGFKPFTRPPRCRLQSFTQLDYKMLDKLDQSLEHDCELSNIHKSFSTPCLSNSSSVRDDRDTNSRIEIIIGHAAPRVRAMVVEVAIAMASGVKPEPTSSGLGGAYFLRSQNGDTIAVAKPIDEEPLAFNNPKGLAGRLLGQPGMKCSIRIGETGLRESAAYVLDHDGFAGVPPTALVRFSHVKFNINNPGSDSTTIYKIASLQRYVKHDSDAGDLGPSSFSVTCVHHIGILDVRLMNLDRHAGNILVRHGQDRPSELVPIDHGFCLPEALDDPYFEWLHWPQASIPFSEAEVEYISGLDPYKDAEMLRSEVPSIGESSIRVLVLCTIFLKQATAYGLCLADIGEMMTRDFNGGDENWSTLENLCINAKARLKKQLTDDRTISILKCDYLNQHEPEEEEEEEEEDEEEDADEDDDEVFKFDEKHEDCHDEASHIPETPTKGKPSKIPRYSSMVVKFANPPLSGIQDYLDDDGELDTFLDKCGNNVDENPKAAAAGGSLMRSVSYSVPNYKRDGQCIYFGEMDDGEWHALLEIFQKLLPEAFEERKSMDLPKHRLGSSCQF
ncbi:phosphatidylinositol 4-kinase gamma 8-like isoform X1 [Salvia miltiorrhiza]|uniref:phosphatidylinositol 4-kinase gamma 8-like isoform X1 n=1 Tax=Salvia miltiorrhiza TaxID=226208 RepID=UPI0025ACA553|nr:phosphatidylinositol 4-kinase gamma 8-like isoform X1 [Salvia miltiorrhiza]